MRGAARTMATIALVLVAGAAGFFTVQSCRFKAELNRSGKGVDVKSGQTVFVTRVVDGDEVSVTLGDQQFAVRLLGIQAFSPKVNDPLTVGLARQAFGRLEASLSGREATVVFDEFKQDRFKRVLAYLQVGGADVGFGLVESGLALAFTKYAFSRMDGYAAAEDRARAAGAGLWSLPALAERVRGLRVKWDAERNKEGK